jgi:hypothetical protein
MLRGRRYTVSKNDDRCATCFDVDAWQALSTDEREHALQRI